MSDQKPRSGPEASSSENLRARHDEAADLIGGQPTRRAAAPRGANDLDLVRLEHERETPRDAALTRPPGPLPGG